MQTKFISALHELVQVCVICVCDSRGRRLGRLGGIGRLGRSVAWSLARATGRWGRCQMGSLGHESAYKAFRRLISLPADTLQKKTDE